MSEHTTIKNPGKHDTLNGDEAEFHDPGRADYVPKGKAKKYQRKFEDGDKVWMKTATRENPDSPEATVYVKEARYEEETGKEGWMYKVQAKDGQEWIGVAREKKEKSLGRA